MGRGPPSHWKLSGALSPLLHFGPAFLLSDSFVTSGPNSAPPYPQLPLSPLAWHSSILSQPVSSAAQSVFLSSRTPLPHKPSHLVKALLQSPYQCKCSAIILSLSAPWAPGLTGTLLVPLGPSSLSLCRLPLLWWPPLYSKRPLTLLNWTELSWLSCVKLYCASLHNNTLVQCGWTGWVQYSVTCSVTRATLQLVLCPSNHRTVTAICPAHDGTQRSVISMVVPQPWPVVYSSFELDWTGPSWTCP